VDFAVDRDMAVITSACILDKAFDSIDHFVHGPFLLALGHLAMFKEACALLHLSHDCLACNLSLESLDMKLVELPSTRLCQASVLECSLLPDVLNECDKF